MPDSRLISSVSIPAGQPAPGNSASSAAKPLEKASTAAWPIRLARQTVPGNGEEDIVPSSQLAAAQQADADAFDREGVGARIDDDGCEVGILGQQFDRVAAPPPALDGDLVADARNDDLSVARFMGLTYREQIAIEDAGVAHAHAA